MRNRKKIAKNASRRMKSDKSFSEKNKKKNYKKLRNHNPAVAFIDLILIQLVKRNDWQILGKLKILLPLQVARPQKTVH